MKRNEIWWAQLPEPAGRRPVLLISRDEAIGLRRKVVVAEITTTVRALPTEVVVGAREGLERRSVVTTENLFTIPKEWLHERVGSLSRVKIDAVDDALRFALDLE